MNKKSTLLAAALMAVSSFTANAAEADPKDQTVPADQWIAGNYYYLKNVSGNFLALDSQNQDSVIIRKSTDPVADKAMVDLALWEVASAGTEISGEVYQFVNKRTKKILSFAKDLDAEPILAEGISKWSFPEAGGNITAKLSSSETMKLSIDSKGKLVFKGGTAITFSVVKAKSDYELSAKDLGNGFTTFQLSMGETIEGDIFKGKDLIATEKDGYILLQEKGDEAYDNGVKKYFGIDTLKIEGAEALNTLGYKFSLDSIREETGKVNKFAKLFKFTADLKNDSLTMIVCGVPGNDSETKDVKVVYAKLDNKKVLTITDSNGGISPFITTKRGTPAEISTGTGVYFLKSANKDANEGKYLYVDASGVSYKAEKPSVNKIDGQWFISENDGMYKIISRQFKTGTEENCELLAIYSEIFAVQGMDNTYLIGSDSITVEHQEVNLDDKFLGSVNFTKDELANNGYVLNLVPTGAETSKTYTFTADSILQVKSGEAKDAVVFKIVAVDTTKVGGALSLKDTISIVKYNLKSQFSDKYVAYDNAKASLKVSDFDPALKFKFNTNTDGGTYNMQIDTATAINNKYVDAQVSSSNMVLSETPAYFNFVEMDAPEYGTFDSGNKRFTSDLKSLTMNPLNFFAEAKQEGQEILKSTYEKDNFSLWLSKSKASTAEKPLYFIMTSQAVDGVPGVDRTYYYMVSGRDSSLLVGDAPRVNFIVNDTIETMKNSAANPALWALKVNENGSYLLENQQEKNSLTQVEKYPYVGIVNNVVVMSKTGVEFSVETAPAPVANEEIEAPTTVKVIGGVGEFSIRNAHGKKITVSNILGQTIATRIVSSDYVTVPTTRGVVIVSVEGDKAYKVIVK